MLKKVVYAGSNDPAFKRASQDLLVLAEVTVPAKQVERLTERIGHGASGRGATPPRLPTWPGLWAQREEMPLGKTASALAVAEMDGGRLPNPRRHTRTFEETTARLGAATLEGTDGGRKRPPWPAMSAGRPRQPLKPDSASEQAHPRPSTGVKNKVGCLLRNDQ